jgi:serine/threonine protein kinase
MQTGQHVTPTIKLVRPLDQGAMGAVWVAEHLALDTLVAVKFMAPGYADNERSVLRFRQEAQAAARIKSPHVTTVFDHGITTEGQPYIVMELLEGETLGERIKRAGPMLIEEVVRLVRQTARGLGSAHRLGVVHRDIKPANLFLIDVEGEPFVKVLDFGIAKQVQAEPGATSTGTAMGTPLYMSPEQFGDAKRVDHRTDLWALGVVAYEALTAKTPFDGPTILALALAVQKGAFTPPSALRPELPPAVDAWMARALAVDVEARFGGAMDMAEALAVAAQRTDARERRSSAPPSMRAAIVDTVPMPPEQSVPLKGATVAGKPASVRADAIRRVSRQPSPKSERPARIGPLVTDKPQPARIAPPVTDEPQLEMVYDRDRGFLSLSLPGTSSRAIAFHETGELLFVAFRTGQVLCLDLATRWPRWWHRLSSRTVCIAVSPWQVAVGCKDGSVRLFNVARGTLEKTLEVSEYGAVRTVAIHGGGRVLAAAGDDKLVSFWSVNGRRLHTGRGHTDRIRSVAFSADALASGASDATVLLWDSPPRDTPPKALHRGGGIVYGVVFASHGGSLAAACDDGGVRLWFRETRGWELARTLTGDGKPVRCAAFDWLGQALIAGSSDGTVRVWEVLTGKVQRVLAGNGATVSCVATSPDGRYAAAACEDGSVRVYRWPLDPWLGK